MKNAYKNSIGLSSASLESYPCNESSRPKTIASLDTRLTIAVTSYRWGKHDPDGVSIKAVLDGLIRESILQDDSTDQIKEIKLISKKVKNKSDERTIINIYSGEIDGRYLE